MKRILVTLALSAVAATAAMAQTPGDKLDTEAKETWKLWNEITALNHGPNGDQWDVDEMSYETRFKAFVEQRRVYDQDFSTWNQANSAFTTRVNQWSADCGKDAHPNGLAEPMYSQCTGRKQELKQEMPVYDDQRASLQTRYNLLESQRLAFVNERQSLEARAAQYNAARRQLNEQYNSQLSKTQDAWKTYDACVKGAASDCGTTPDFTPEQVAKIPTFVPLTFKQNGATAFAGKWQITWTGDGGFLYNGVLTLSWGLNDSVEGQIDWTLVTVPEGEKYNDYRKLIGSTATEFVKGNSTQFAGYLKTDPKNIIGLDTYRLAVSDDKNSISGKTYTGHKDWGGQLQGTRIH